MNTRNQRPYRELTNNELYELARQTIDDCRRDIRLAEIGINSSLELVNNSNRNYCTPRKVA